MRILLVDDEPSLTQLLGQLLARGGHEVLLAASVAEANSRIETQDLDAAVIDLLLPDGNGEDVARAVIARHPRAKAVLATGMAHELAPDLEKKVLLLQKPFMPRALLKVLTDGGQLPL